MTQFKQDQYFICLSSFTSRQRFDQKGPLGEQERAGLQLFNDLLHIDMKSAASLS